MSADVTTAIYLCELYKQVRLLRLDKQMLNEWAIRQISSKLLPNPTSQQQQNSDVSGSWLCMMTLNRDYYHAETYNRTTEPIAEITTSQCLWHAIRQLFHSSCARYLSLNCLNSFANTQILISILPGLNAFANKTKYIGNDSKTRGAKQTKTNLVSHIPLNVREVTNTYLGETLLMWVGNFH